jgi:hypothetical protein
MSGTIFGDPLFGQDIFGQRGSIPGDFRPTKVVDNAAWMAKFETPATIDFDSDKPLERPADGAACSLEPGCESCQ